MDLAGGKVQGPETGRTRGDRTCPLAASPPVAFSLPQLLSTPKFLLRPKLLCYLLPPPTSPPATGHSPGFVWPGSCHGSCPGGGLPLEGALIPTAARPTWGGQGSEPGPGEGDVCPGLHRACWAWRGKVSGDWRQGQVACRDWWGWQIGLRCLLFLGQGNPLGSLLAGFLCILAQLTDVSGEAGRVERAQLGAGGCVWWPG